MKRFLFFATVLIMIQSSFVVGAEKLTYIDLISKLTDLEYLATLPQPGQKCQMASSYDRASKYDAVNDKYVNWIANGDGWNFVSKDNGKLVMADIKGPGVIWRIWSAQAKEGHVKFYFDGSDIPAIDMPWKDYFNRSTPPFDRSALVYTSAKGLNIYLPIPFRKSCKVVAQNNWGRYYHINYTTYPQETELTTFKMSLSEEESVALDKANENLSSCGLDPAAKRKSQKTIKKTITIAPGQTENVLDLKGKYAITALKVKVENPNSDILRQLTLSMYWDGEKSPSVWSPIGDFFGSAPGVNLYKSLPLGMTADGFYSYWYMPFKKSALLQITNDGKESRNVTLAVTYAKLDKPIKNLGRFHAKWHRDAFLPKEKQRWIDWTILKTKGPGRFCGTLLNIWNPRGTWWGEGDEKFFVDGEKFPSTFGTGSEDYFGYAWGNGTLFARAYNNQTKCNHNRGHISVSRWHITDNVPFQESFEGCIEKYYKEELWDTRYDAVAYWYQQASQSDDYPVVCLKDRLGYWTPPKGVIEGEDLKIISKTAGNAARQKLSSDWSGGEHLFWKDVQIGAKLNLGFDIEKNGKYCLKTQLTRSTNYAIVQLYIDSQKIGNPVDLYLGYVYLTQVMILGEFDFTSGEHTMTIEVVGINKKAGENCAVGIDYLQIERIN